VRFRYRDAKTGALQTRRLPGADFLWLMLSHLLPRGFRRSRTYGLTHHRRTILLRRVQLMLHVVIPIATPKTRRPVLCWRCGQPMRIRVIPRTFRIDVETDSPAQANGSATV
jgi:hypothetical protein